MPLAQIIIDGYQNPSNKFTDADTLPAQIISRTLLFAIAAAGLYFFYQLIISGFSYMTAMGDEARLKEVIKRMTNAAIGLIIIISAFFILQIIQTITGTELV
jgi:hypothetical protein